MTGRTLAGRYKVTEELSRGTNLSIFLAADTACGTEVEVDVLKVLADRAPVHVGRLGEIMDMAIQVGGPHVAAVHCWGEEAEEGLVYVVRERVSGASLAEVLACTAELPMGQVVEITAAVVEVLAEAYGNNLFYLGLNPYQVILDGRGVAKLVRVGFGWILEEMEPDLAARVSPYRAPETDGGREGSRTSDVYSLAVMMREMLPEGELGPRLESLLDTATDLMPKRRPSSPRLLLEELESCGYGGGETPPGGGGARSPECGGKESGRRGLSFLESANASPVAGLAQRPRRRMLRNLLLVLAGGAVLWLLFAALAGLLGGGAGEEPRPPAVAEERIILPDLQGLTVADAEETLRELGLRCTSREAPSRLWSAGRVAAHEPAEGAALRPGDAVCLVISTGRDEREVADAGGDPVPAAADAASPPGSEGTPQPQGALLLPSAWETPQPAGNLPPRAVPALSSGGGPAPLYVCMDGSASHDPDGEIVRYVWHCGDGTVIEGVRAQHVYDPAVIPARFQVVLEVFDAGGLSNSSSLILEVY